MKIDAEDTNIVDKYQEELYDLISQTSIAKNNVNTLSGYLKKEKKIVIYGAGYWGKTLLSILQNYSIDIHSFLDVNAEIIGNVEGIPVFRPDSDKFTKSEKQEICVVVAANFIHHDRIKIDLGEMGYKNIKTIPYIWYAGWLNFERDCEYVCNNKERMLNCVRIFKDQKSLMIYRDVLSSYMTAECTTSIEPEPNNQYLPDDIHLNKGYSHFVDCGAFTGDTIEQIQKYKGKFETVIAFEADCLNYRALVKTLKTNKSSIATTVILYPCGVWSNHEQINFNSGSGSGSEISEKGKTVIQCVTLDEVLLNFRPTLIKMDIEGAEYEALLGAQKVIHNNRPDLAVCVYHSIIDFFRIPLLIHDWDLDYQFFLRCHQGFNQEIVMYATSSK